MRYLISEHGEKPFLFAPVNRAAGLVNLRIFADGQVVDEQSLRIGEPAEMLAAFSLEAFRGQRIEAEFFDDDKTEEHPELSALLFTGDRETEEAPLDNTRRPLIHYTCKKGFLNDPNGLLYYDGWYHMFYQYNPYGVTHGNTCWGHARSRDCLHWEELAPAIWADREDGCIFSGSGVVDYDNTSGLKDGEAAPILLFYTATGYRFPPRRYFDHNFDAFFLEHSSTPFTKQGIACSTDGGRSFRKYENNPVLTQRAVLNRDPKVVWVPSLKAWVMLLFLQDHTYQFFYSENLLDWEDGERISLEDCGECPDLFSLPLGPDSTVNRADVMEKEKKWILWGAPGNYKIGHFEGRHFEPETGLIRGWCMENGKYASGGAFAGYAPQTFYGLPGGRVLQLYWITEGFEGAGFASCMSLPVELSLVSGPAGPRLRFQPCEETKSLRRAQRSFHGITTEGLLTEGAAGEAFELELRAAMGARGRIVLSVRGILLIYDREDGRFICPSGNYEIGRHKDVLELRIWADRGVMELYTADGSFHTMIAAEAGKRARDAAVMECRDASLSGNLWELASIWERSPSPEIV
nr:glycoside hydrolase family 32 protein [uncultured Eisenbergiella sp.]